MTSYNFRDLFTTIRTAGNVDGTAAEPGTGSRTVVDTASIITIPGSRLKIEPSSGTWGNASISWPAITRAAGRCLVGLINPTDQDVSFAFGLANAALSGDPRNNGFGFHAYLKRLGIISDLASAAQYLESLRGLRPIEHLVVIALSDIGAVVMVSAIDNTSGFGASESELLYKYPAARVVWADYQDETASLIPYLSGADSYGSYLRDVRVVDIADWSSADALTSFADRFTRSDSNSALGNDWTAHSGVWGISSNQAYQVSGAGRTVASHATSLTDGDAVWHWKFVMPSGQVELPFRVVDENNYIFAYATNTVIGLYKLVSGTGSLIGQTNYTFTAGNTFDLTIISVGNKYRLFIDGACPFGGAWQTDAESSHLTATRIGIGAWSNPSGELFDNVACWPLSITLPADILDGAGPNVAVTGDVILTDSFTDSNDSALDAHQASNDAYWTEVSGTWTIQSNRASPATGSDSIAVIDAGTNLAEVETDIITPDSGDSFFAGLLVLYEDANNYIEVRILMSPDQAENDEVEINRIVSGVSSNVGKYNIADYYAVSSTYNLKAQVTSAGWLHVWLDDQIVFSYCLEATDPSGTYVGVKIASIDAGCVFDNFSVKDASSSLGKVQLPKTRLLGNWGNYAIEDIVDVTMTAADSAWGNIFTASGNDGLIAYNSGGSAGTITIVSVADPITGRLDDIEYSLGAGEYAFFGPFGMRGWASEDSLRAITVQCSSSDIYLGVVYK